jgi:DNA-binding response OmpR family regulator
VAHILIAEDEPSISSLIEKGLVASGHATSVVADGTEAIELAASGRFDLLLLDLSLPGTDGYGVLGELRSRGSGIPVVILTGRGDQHDLAAGLERGADDYIRKPFRFAELLARIRARLRASGEGSAILRAGDATLDLNTRRLATGDRTVQLTAREFALAEAFFRRPGEVLTRAELLRHCWGEEPQISSNVLDVYIGHLRQKLGETRIRTERGRGYRLEAGGAQKGTDAAAGGRTG